MDELEKNLIQTKKYIVGYIDVLGATKMIREDQDKSLKVIHDIYDSSLNLYRQLFESKTRFNFKFFSDNIVVAIRAVKEVNLETYFSNFTILISLIQLNFLTKNILIRGGIAYEGYFSDERMVWGKALTRAYELENKIAVFPRIVVDPDLVGKLKAFQNNEHTLKDLGVRQDIDGFCFIDYLLDVYLSKFPSFVLLEMEKINNRISNEKDIKILQKYIWHQNYLLSKIENSH